MKSIKEKEYLTKEYVKKRENREIEIENREIEILLTKLIALLTLIAMIWIADIYLSYVIGLK